MTPSEANRIVEVRVGSDSGDYPVFVGRGALDRIEEYLGAHAPAFRYAVITDEHVAPLYGARVLEACSSASGGAALYTFPPGEASKTRKSWSILTDELLDAGCGRDTCVVAVGGGVTGDLAGFVAATYLRGVPCVQVPTSYLAMIDASVGGKTGVDVQAGKNLVGAFHPPRCVIVDPDVLNTLPQNERAEGLVEAMKHGAILDADYLHELVRSAGPLLAADPVPATAAVLRSVQIKASVVTRDEREGGYRQILNFGHTIGHAVEVASDFRVGHGTAVAIGMLIEAELGERLGVTEAGTADSLAVSLGALGFDRRSAGDVDADAVMSYLASDKKARSGRPRYVLLRRVGSVAEGEGWSHTVPDELVREVVDGLELASIGGGHGAR